MKRLFAVFAVVFCGILLTGAEPVKKLRILAIGNSFSISVDKELAKIVKSDPASEMRLRHAYIGGCSLQRHWEEHLKSEKDSAYKPYSKKYSLRDLLTEDKWDIVTIQQSSPLSWKKETYEPYAGNLIKLVRELAPSAEILIQQTWSYNAASAQFRSTWKYAWKYNGQQVTQDLMYECLTDSYTSTAKQYKLRIIPTGYAIRQYRKAMGDKLVSMAPANYQDLVKPAVPTTNDVVGCFFWRHDEKKGQETLRLDTKHLNERGHYFQSLVWYAALFGKDPEKITYRPDFVSGEEAELFKKCAKEAVATFPQVK